MPPPSQEEGQVPEATTLDEGQAISSSREDATKHQVIKISVAPTSKVVAIVFGFLSALIYVPLGAYLLMANSGDEGIALFFLVAPFIMVAFTYVYIAIVCGLYNVVAGSVGGIEVSLSQSERAKHGPQMYCADCSIKIPADRKSGRCIPYMERAIDKERDLLDAARGEE